VGGLSSGRGNLSSVERYCNGPVCDDRMHM
jgi:hypothetical protein